MAEHVRPPHAILSVRTFLRTTIPALTLALALLAGSRQEVHATHAMGGDLTYQCVGPNQYKVTLSFYRDCNGVAAPTNCNNGRQFRVRSTQCNANFTDCFTLENVQIITPICPGEPDRCNTSSGTYGVEKYTFSKIINLNAWAGCGTDWIISWDLCCRNNAITSLQNPGNQNLYLEARLNNTLAPCNSSPSFLTNPTPFYCLGQSVSYNPGAFDADGDSLSFELIQARGANGNNIPYAAGYTVTQPIRNGGGAGAVQLDPTTGTLTVIPNQLQVAVVSYRIREFRNGVPIGEVVRDIQVVVRACAGNTAPSASGINGTGNFSTQVCAGTPITFTINSSDPNAGQAVTMTWNSGIPGATFTTSGSPFPTGTFTWTPPITAIGNNVFTVTVTDNACPLVGTNDFGYSILVTPPFTPANAGPDQSVCATSATLAGVQPYAQAQGTWTVVSGSGVFANANSPTTTVTGLSPGANVFQWSVNYQTCGIATDQVTITSFNPGQAAANAGPDQQLCTPNTSTTMAGNVAVAPAVGTWTLVTGTGTIASPNDPNTAITGLGVGNNVFRWTINNGPCGAPTQDVVTIQVFSSAQGAANAGPDQALCAPTLTTNLAGNALIAPATGQWTVVQGTGTFANANSPTTQVSGLSIGVNRFRWTINNGPCTPGSTQDEVDVVVFDPNSPSANAGPDLQLCAPPTSITLTGSVPIAPATGAWSLVSGSGTIVSPGNPTTLVTGLGLGNNVFQWTVNNGPCANGLTNDQVVVTVFSSASPAADAGADQELCSTTSSTFLNGSVPIAPSTGVWTLVSGSGTIVTPSSPTTQVTGLGVGNNVFQWTVNNGPCPTGITNDQVTIRVFDANSPAANAGPDQSICSSTPSVTMAANAPVFPALGVWSLVSGSGIIVSPNSPTTIITGLGIGSNVFQWTLDNGVCPNGLTSDQVTIVVFDSNNPVANAGPDQQLCGATSTTLAGSSLTAPATGTWTLVSGTGSIVSPGSPSTAITGMAVGANTFRWTVNNGPCGASTNDEVTVFVFDPNQPVANAGPDQQLCGSNVTATMAGSTVIFPGTGTWTLLSGAGIITNPNSPTTTVTNLPIGVHVLQWTVNNGPCGAPTTDQVTITVFDPNNPVANAGPDQEICIPTFPSQVFLQGSNVNPPAVGTWTLVSGNGTIVSPNDPNTLVTGLTGGINVFRWTVSNGACPNSLSFDEVSIFVFDAANPVANAGPDQIICTPVNSTVMAGSSLIAPATGTWTLVSGSGTIVDPSSPTTQITGLPVGTHVFQWTVSNGPCANPLTSDQVVINVINGNAQQANAGPDQVICSTTTTVTLAGNQPTGLATGQWSVIQGSAVFGNASQFNTTVTGLSIGTNVLQWTIDNAGCGLSSDVMTITVFNDAQASANAGPDQEICVPTAPSQVTMQANAVAFPAVGTWTLVSGTGTILNPNSPNTVINDLSVGENIFQWTVNNGPCANGNTSDLVSIFVFDAANPVANAGPNQQLCFPNTSTTLAGSSLIFPASGQWSVVQGTAVFADATSPTTTVSGLSIGLNRLRWTVSNGPCANPITTDEMDILVFDPNNPVANAGPDQQLCETTLSTTMAGSSLILPATGSWAVVSGSGTFADPNSPTTTVTGYGVGQNIYTWTVNNGPCANGLTVDTMSLFVFDTDNPFAGAGPDQQLCTPTNSTTLVGSALIFPATGTWVLLNGQGTITNSNSPTTTVTNLGVGVNTFQWTVSNGPCPGSPSFDAVDILLFDQNNPVANAGPDQDLCSPQSSTVMAGSALIAPATGTWTLVSGTGTIVSPNSPTTQITGLPVGEHIFRWTVSNGPCNNPITFDDVRIRVFDSNVPPADAGPDQELCTPNVNTVMAGSPIVFPATGTWTLVSGSGTINSPNSPTTTITNLGVGANVFEWTVDNGPCSPGISTSQVTLFVFDANNANANAGPDQELCTPTGTTIASTLAGSAVIFPAAGTWTLVSGTGVIADANDPNSAVDGLSIGENIFQWSVSNGPCANGLTTDQVSIFVFDENNPLADAGPDQDLCLPATSATLSGSPVTFPATGVWTLVSGTATITNPNDPNTTVTDLIIGEVVLEWTVDNGPCASGITTDQVTIRLFDDENPLADAGPDQDLCTPNTSTTLQGSVVNFPAVGTWTVLQGNAVFADANDPTTTVSDLSVGEVILVWTVDNGPCASGITTDQVSLFVYDENNPVADAGPDQDLCTPNTSTNLQGSAIIFPATGTWTLVTGNGQIADPNDPNTLVTGLTVGENIFAWTVSNGPCANPLTTDVVSIFVYDENNPVADAGPDQDICTPITSATLSGSVVTFPATGTWTLVSGSGTITDPADPNTTVTALGIGANVFEWTVDNGPCATGITTDQVTIQLFDENAPPADAGPDQQLCTPTSTTTLQGNAPVGVATGTWTVQQGTAQFVDPNDPNTDVTGLTVGEHILVWTIDNSVCGISSDAVSIFVFDENNPPANAGPDEALCMPQDSTFLAGNTPIFPAFGTWSVVQGAGQFADANDPNTLVTGLAIGANIFQWTTDNGPCNNPITLDLVTITLFDDSTAAANAGPDQEICLPLTATTLDAATPQPPATGSWTIISGAGTLADPLDPSSAITDLQVGITTLVWELNNGPCPPNGIMSDTVSIFIYDPSAPLANAGPDQELCTPGTADTNLEGNPATFPGVGTWTLINGGGTIVDVNDPTTAVTDMPVGENIFVWTIYNGQCGFGPPSSDTVSVFVFDENQPPAATGPDQELCTPQTTSTLSANDAIFPATGTWTVVAGGASLDDANDPNTGVSGLTVGENLFVWTIDNGPCPNAITTDTLSILLYDENSPPADAGPDQSICVPTFPNTVTMAANTPIFPAVGTWTLVSGSGTIVSPNDPNTLITDLTVGAHVFEWSVSNGPCPNGNTSDQVTILVYDAAQGDANVGNDIQLCTPASSTGIQGNTVIFPATGTWSIISGPGTIQDPGASSTSITGLSVGQTVLLWTIDNGPCSNGITTDTLVINVYDGGSAPALAGNDQSFCSPAPDTDMFASSPTFPAIGTWTLVSGSGTIADPNDPFTAITDLGLGANVFQWTIDNGACGTTSDEVTLFVFDSSVPPADAGDDQEFCQHSFSGANLDGSAVFGLATGTWSQITGAGQIASPNDPGTLVTGLAGGVNAYLWTVDNGPCGTSSDTVLIVLKDCLSIKIPNAFSPNGDGVNDVFIIENLENYPDNSFVVFNRWGSKVFERRPYRNDWDGRSENSMNWGSELPESAYYYVLDVGNGIDPFTGYIYIRR